MFFLRNIYKIIIFLSWVAPKTTDLKL